MTLLGHLYNCWQFRDSLDGAAGQPFVIAAPVYEPGKFVGNGLRCDATINSTGPAPGTATFPMIGNWAGALWFKPITLPSPKATVLVSNINLGAGSAGFRLRFATNGAVDFNIIDASGQNIGVVSAPVTLNEWHLAIFGHDKNTLKGFLRVDDVQTDLPNPFTISTGLPANITVGNFPLMNNTGALNAVLSLLALWSGRNPTTAEMQALWNGGAGLDYPWP